MPEEKLIRRRLPAIEKIISDIHPDSDVRIRVLGTIIDMGSNSIVLDDGTGKIEVYFEELPEVKQGQMVRIITRIIPLIDGYECKGEVLQKLDGFNIELYKKARSLG
ncbi:MAG: hypothetical protein V1678_03940 [Candidatus Aenigmatarchaeota archaeon]